MLGAVLPCCPDFVFSRLPNVNEPSLNTHRSSLPRAQDETLSQYAKRMEELSLITTAVQRRRQSEFAERVQEIRRQHVAQCDRLLRFCRMIEALESRAFRVGPLVREVRGDIPDARASND